jgi:hypothetical protein
MTTCVSITTSTDAPETGKCIREMTGKYKIKIMLMHIQTRNKDRKERFRNAVFFRITRRWIDEEYLNVWSGDVAGE